MTHILIVEARFYGAIADAQLAGAGAALTAAGATHDVLTVPGALEIPAAINPPVQAGVFPNVEHGSSVTYAVAPCANSPASRNANTSACASPAR